MFFSAAPKPEATWPVKCETTTRAWVLTISGGELYFSVYFARDRYFQLFIAAQAVGHDHRHAGVLETKAVALGQFNVADGLVAHAAVQRGGIGQKGQGLPLFDQGAHHFEIQRPHVPLRILLAEVGFKSHHVFGQDKGKQVVGHQGPLELPADLFVRFIVGDRE